MSGSPPGMSERSIPFLDESALLQTNPEERQFFLTAEKAAQVIGFEFLSCHHDNVGISLMSTATTVIRVVCLNRDTPLALQ